MCCIDDFAVESATKHIAEVLWSVPERRETVICLVGETRVLDKLH